MKHDLKVNIKANGARSLQRAASPSHDCHQLAACEGWITVSLRLIASFASKDYYTSRNEVFNPSR